MYEWALLCGLARVRLEARLLVAADWLASRFDTRAPNLRHKAPFTSGLSGLGLLPRLRAPGGLSQQGHEAGPSRSAILGLSAMLAAIDEEHAIGGHLLARQRDQPRLHVFCQRRRGDVEAQFHRGGNLVDVLAPRT